MEKWKKSAYIGVNIVIYIALAYVLLKYAFGIILPFAISFLIVIFSRPLVDKLSSHTKVPKSIVSLFVIGTILTLTICLLVLASSALLEQIEVLIYKISEHLSQEENYITKTIDLLERITEKFPFLKNNTDNTAVYSVALEMAKNMVSALSSSLTKTVGGIIASMPRIVVTVVVIVLSLFYFSKDYGKISSWLRGIFPLSVRDKLPRVKKDVLFVFSGYVRSYAILTLITFAQVFAGLMILRIEGAFALSLIIAFVDLLPVLGVGTVLIPWSIFAFITGNNRLGIGLLVLFTIVYIVRQIIEPRIVSAQMNIHPLIAVFSMYAGLKVAGIGGMIVSPFLAFAIKTVYDGLKKDGETKKDVEKEEKL